MSHPQQGQKKILAVDDEADLTMLCRLALEYYGFQVDTFDNPQEALSIILQVWLLRFNYSRYKDAKMDGFQLYDEIKKKDQKAKVCFLTASELYYEQFRKEEYSAIDKNLFIQKPIQNEELLKEVNRRISSD